MGWKMARKTTWSTPQRPRKPASIRINGLPKIHAIPPRQPAVFLRSPPQPGMSRTRPLTAHASRAAPAARAPWQRALALLWALALTFQALAWAHMPMPSGASGFTLICTPGGMRALPLAHADDPAGLNSPADPAAPDGGLAHASGDICALCTLLHGLAAPVALALLPLPPVTAPGPRLPTARPLLPPTPWALHPARAPPALA